MTPVPILFVDHAAALGGAERSLLLLLEHLDRRRWQLQLVGMAEGPLLAEATRLDVQTFAMALPRLRKSARFPADLLLHANELAQVARRSKAALMVANTIRAAIYAAPAAKLARVGLVWHMRDFWLSENKPHYPLFDRYGKRLLLAASDRVIANSNAVAQHLPSPEKIRVVPNGIDVTSFHYPVEGLRFRKTHHIAPTAHVVGMMGRMRPWKGQLTFLNVARAVHEQAPETRFIIVGGDPFDVADGYAASVEAHATALGLQEIVAFTGQLSDVRPALSAMDLFVHPGEPEPFGLVNVEAMASGLPVVAFGHGALPEIVRDGVTGRLVAPGDQDAMVEAILELLSDEALRADMGNAARERAVREFSIQRVASDIDGIFRTLVGQ